MLGMLERGRRKKEKNSYVNSEHEDDRSVCDCG
jgi:hypothetical protein